jgi:hypothetical protein
MIMSTPFVIVIDLYREAIPPWFWTLSVIYVCIVIL